MKSHFTLSCGVAMACAAGASTLLPSMSTAATFTAADYATNSAYANGWQDTDNGGFGFSHWSFAGTYTTATQHAMNTNSPYNQLGAAWTIYLPNGKPPFGQGQVDSSNPPEDGTDLSRAGRGFSPLQVGQTISTVIDNPTERHFYNGYTINFVTGGSCAGYDTNCTGISRLRVGTFEYFTFGRWYVDSVEGGSPNLFDTNSAAAGMRIDMTLTAPNNYKLVMTPLNNPANAYTNSGTLNGAGPIDWIQFEHYNTDSDFYDAAGPHVATNPKSTDLYIRSITITDVQLLPASIIKQPKSKVLYPGRTARFEVGCLGTFLNYQWRKNGINLANDNHISGAQTNQLVINNISAADVASYTVVITNSLGAVTSSPPATLTLAPPSTTPYETAANSYGPVAYWRLNETNNPALSNVLAQDYFGGNAGVYGSASSNKFNAINGPLPADGFSIFETGNGAMRSVLNTADSWAAMPALNLNTNKVTVTAWINPATSQPDFAGIVLSRFNDRAVGLTMGGAGYGTADQLVYTWNNNSQDTWGFFSGLGIPPGQWSFVALVVDPAQAVLYVYNTSSQASATNAIAHVVEQWDGAIIVGGDPGNSVGRTFDGVIDEVAIFNRALSPMEILNLYNGVPKTVPNVSISIQKVGPNVVLSWPQGTLLEATNVTGPWATNPATSPYTNAPTAAMKLYRVQVQ
jgi:Concanavalin A-like lectin/glucanases superfamily/Immunoglobulin I-set domain